MKQRGYELLAEFLRDHVQARFAEEVDISRPHLSGIIKGDRAPSLTLARRIEVATDGHVPMSAWADDTPPLRRWRLEA